MAQGGSGGLECSKRSRWNRMLTLSSAIPFSRFLGNSSTKLRQQLRHIDVVSDRADDGRRIAGFCPQKG